MPIRRLSVGDAGSAPAFFLRRGRIRPAQPADEVSIRRLLAREELPHEDISRHLGTFLVAELGGSPVGVVGLEPCGDTTGLLRSLAVAAELRGQGVGTGLCDRMLADARRTGIERLYLLTTTAERFFARLGFVPIDRTRAPASVQATLEFKNLCPASATCMERLLDDPYIASGAQL
jgi:amino-acid N-acetyltransferase